MPFSMSVCDPNPAQEGKPLVVLLEESVKNDKNTICLHLSNRRMLAALAAYNHPNRENAISDNRILQ
jgi:hypothetical protein